MEIKDIPKMNTKKILGIIAGTYLALQNSVQAADVSTELAVIKDSSILDIKINNALIGKVDHYIRNLTTINNKTGDVSSFSYVDAIPQIGKELNVLAEIQFPAGSKIDIRPGIQYFTTKGNYLLGGIITRSVSNQKNTTCIGILNYSPKITGTNLNLVANIESVWNIDKENNFNNTKLRLGVKKGSVSGGIATELSKFGRTPSSQVGIFITKNF